jgi:probable F420-dependent oxidoreductase
LRFSLGLPTDRVDALDEFVTGGAVMEMAAAAEAAGFDAVYVTEHPIPGDDWLASGGHHALDPFVALSFAAAATSTLRLLTNLVVAPYRNPFLLAKAAASLDVLSGGRLILGLGAGYLESEFAALGVPFEDRVARFDDVLAVLDDVWTGESVVCSSPRFTAAGNTALPRPVQRPRPPIWLGGNSKLTLRRVAEKTDGWMPLPNPAKVAARRRSPVLESLDDLTARLAMLRGFASDAARSEPIDVMFMPIGSPPYGQDGFSVDALLAEIDAQAALGVTQMAVGFAFPGHAAPNKLATRQQFLDLTERFGKEVIGR